MDHPQSDKINDTDTSGKCPMCGDIIDIPTIDTLSDCGCDTISCLKCMKNHVSLNMKCFICSKPYIDIDYSDLKYRYRVMPLYFLNELDEKYGKICCGICKNTHKYTRAELFNHICQAHN